MDIQMSLRVNGIPNILDIVNNRVQGSGTSISFSTFRSVYDNAEQLQCNPISVNVTQNNISAYLNGIFGRPFDYGNVLYSGVTKVHGSITKGLVDNTQRYDLAFQPSYTGASTAGDQLYVPSGTPKGKFSSKQASDAFAAIATGAYSFTNLNYKFSTDGKAVPQSKSIDLTTGSISGSITETIYSDISQVPGYSTFKPFETNGNKISTKRFDLDNPTQFYQPSDTFSSPSVPSEDEEGATTTIAPPTTQPPATSEPPAVTTTQPPIIPSVSTTIAPSSIAPINRSWIGNPPSGPSFVCPT